MGEAGDCAQGKYGLLLTVSECHPGRGGDVPGTHVRVPKINKNKNKNNAGVAVHIPVRQFLEPIQLKNSLFVNFLEVLLSCIHYPTNSPCKHTRVCCHVGTDVVRA